MKPWKACLDPSRVYWTDYAPLFARLGADHFPTPGELTTLLPAGMTNAQGRRIRFVSSEGLRDVPYEERVYNSGQVGTRPLNWHDLFNALVWARWPRLKCTINTLHHREMPPAGNARQGKRTEVCGRSQDIAWRQHLRQGRVQGA